MINSNYPRTSSVSSVPVAVDQLRKLTKDGIMYAAFFGTGSVLSDCLSTYNAIRGVDPFDFSKSNSLGVMGPISFIFLYGALKFIPVVFKWVRLAWLSTTATRNLEPKIDEKAAAWLSVIPVINMVGLMYILEWLVVRSRSATDPTVKWYSVKSINPNATAFVYALAAHIIGMILPTVPIIERRGAAGLIVSSAVSSFGLILALVYGYKVCAETNENLAQSQSDVLNLAPVPSSH